MEERHIIQLIQNLIDRFEYVGEHEFNLDAECGFLVHPVTRQSLPEEVRGRIEKAFLERVQYKKAHDGAILIPVSVVSEPKDHEEWYDEWLAENNDEVGCYYWKRLENFLSQHLTSKYGAESAGHIVKAIDEATFTIMEKLAKPTRKQFTYKGLVVGYVQSGKTANFTALIAKAADTGYKLIVVLAGIHNALRRQTQVRLDRELTGVKDIDGPEDYISLPGSAKAWNRLTTAHNDFSISNLGLFENYCRFDTPTLAVVKKNVRVLDRMIEYFSKASSDLRENVSVLIIDDEADQASVDSNANDPDSDPTRTNEKIRRILGLFSKRAYVGYTATPFANVLIDMTAEHGVLLDDLYPRNFIVSLPEPAGYFGTSMIFRGDLSNRFVVPIPNRLGGTPYDEAAVLTRGGVMTEFLARAIDEFIMCCAARNLRGDQSKPMSMLVHVSHRINEMSVIKGIISNDDSGRPGYIQTIHGRYCDSRQSSELRNQFRRTWEQFRTDASVINAELKLANDVPTFDAIWRELKNVLERLQVMELNSASEDALDYTTGAEIKVIAVGGNQLSRGLTLEGLMTSYYLRESRQYDTLLQMGRWFGYRHGYEDLTRIHTTEQIWGFFEHLALVEQELRHEIYRYEEEQMTPLQMAIAIRDHRNLTVTAPNKMGAGRLRQASYSDSLNQTIWFPLDQPDILRKNLTLGDRFIDSINNEGGFINEVPGVFLAREKINGKKVLNEFLIKYAFADRESTGGPGLDSENLLAYISRRLEGPNSELNEWSIAVVGNINSTQDDGSIVFGGLQINKIKRSRRHTQKGYNIGVLTEPAHLNVDIPPLEKRSPQNPLLLLYLIGRNSSASTWREMPSFGQRIDLFRYINSEKIDVLGIAIVLPKSDFEPNNYIGQ